MEISKVLLELTKISILNLPSPSGEVNKSDLLFCKLKWRFQRLWISPNFLISEPSLSLLNDEQWLIECLKRSDVRTVHIAPELGDVALTLWASACDQARKPVFLRLPSLGKLRKHQKMWRIKRFLDRVVAFFLVLFLTPAFVLLVIFIYLDSRGPILTKEWCVGERGKLFCLLKFQSEDQDQQCTPIGRLICRFGLDQLPQLLNVLRGDMSLVGLPPWKISDIPHIPRHQQVILHALPGLITFQEVEKWNLDGVESVFSFNFNYLHTWSIKKDLIFLLSKLKLLLTLVLLFYLADLVTNANAI